MFVLIKFLHFLGLMMGAGSGVGSMLVLRGIKSSPGAPPPQLLAMRPVLGMIGLIGILLIWATGLWLYYSNYAGTTLGAAFQVKVAVAAVMLVFIIATNVAARRAMAARTPPPAWVPKLGMSVGPLALVAVLLAVYVFN